MQQLKLKRLKKKSEMPSRNTLTSKLFELNKQKFCLTIEMDGRVFIENYTNGKMYGLINEINYKE